jgi:hypothetical protein
MKFTYKVAPLMIVFLLGVFVENQAFNTMIGGDTLEGTIVSKKNQPKFSGIIIEPNPADRLLFSKNNQSDFSQQRPVSSSINCCHNSVVPKQSELMILSNTNTKCSSGKLSFKRDNQSSIHP